jgi:competence protein ComEC
MVIPALACRMRNKLLACYGRAGLSPEQEALLAALTLGYREDVDASTEKAFSRAGVMHIMALSGFNVGILAAVLLFLLGGFRNRNSHRFPSIAITLSLIWSFAFVTGMSPSVTRAAVMISLTLSGSSIRYRVHTPNILLASGFIMLSVSPQMLFDAGFQLSFAAVAGIVLFEPTLNRLLKTRFKIVARIWQLFALSCAAQLATLPLTLMYFHQFPLYFWLTNLYVVPLVSVIIVMGMVFLLCCWWYPVSLLLGKLLGMLLNHLLFSVTLTEHLPGALIGPVHITCIQAVLLAGVIFCLALYLKKNSHVLLRLVLAGGILFQAHGIFMQMEWEGQRIFMIPYAKKLPVVLFVTGRKAVLYTDSVSQASRAALSRALDGFYLSRGIRPLTATGAGVLQPGSGSFPQPENYLFDFHGMKVLWLRNNKIATGRKGSGPTPDFLVISKGCRLDAALVLKVLPARQVVLDGSASMWQCDQWEKVCMGCGVPCHAVPRQGAYVYEMGRFRDQISTGPIP